MTLRAILKTGIILVLVITALLLIPATSVYSRAEVRAEEEADEPPLARYRTVIAEVSAYTSSPDETDDTPFETAWGTRPERGTLACPSKYPLGTWVEINGKKYLCEDRMNARYRDKEVFDMWMPSKKVAYQWGRQEITVKVYD